MSDPLAWLPFDPSLLGDLPAGVRCRRVVPEAGDLPDGADEVEFFVPAYEWTADLSVLARMPRLRVVQTLTAGVEHIRPHLPAGVTLCSGRGIHDASTSELAVALMLAAQRGLPDLVRSQARHEWAFGHHPSLADRSVLIVGYGAIGAALEERLTPFEVSIVRVARSERPGVHAVADLPALLPDVDIVVLVAPLTEETHGLFDEGMLRRLRPGALLVNVGRGPLVDTEALVAALHEGRVRAALDVVDPEPLPPHHPLWDAPGLLFTPHVGGSTSALWPRAHRLVREQLQRFAAGEALHNVVTGPY
jgi:phosphoglycerate dehydrogenase-like enzyme